MKVRRIRTWEDLEALPEGEWVEVEEGMDFKWVDQPTVSGIARAIVPDKRRLAKSRVTKKSNIRRTTAKVNQRTSPKGSSFRKLPRKPHP